MRKKFLLILLIMLLTLTGCGKKEEQPAAQKEPIKEAENTEIKIQREYTLRISELMSKNLATIRDEDGDFSDWLELENYGSNPMPLAGLTLNDKISGKGWELPDRELMAGECLLVYASGKDRQGEELHTDFSLSEGEVAALKDEYGDVISTLECLDAHADISVIADEEEGAKRCFYPTPGAENSAESFVKYQNSLPAPQGLMINEVVVSNSAYFKEVENDSDWVELKNPTAEAIDLSKYYLTDDMKQPKLMQLPKDIMNPDAIRVFYCDERLFSLASDYDRLYLTDGENIVDYIPLHNTTYGGSVGREKGKNGFFYYTVSSPNSENINGYRYMSETPKSLQPDGVFNGTEGVTVELEAKGKIYYTLDGKLPDENSLEYKGPFTVSETTAVRAVAIEKGAMPSRPLALNYIINENHDLPVLCLNMNNFDEFYNSYMSGWKECESIGNLSFYEPDGSFSIDGAVRLNGETSLAMVKKNLSVRFRGSLGQSELNYDLYGGGVTEFRDLVLRAGQDYYATVIKNELCQELCLEFTDSVISQRSRFCAMYVNGRYFGLYTVKEKCNAALYANIRGVDTDKVSAEEANVYNGTGIYDDVILFAINNDMSRQENYETVCERLDIDSLIDWLIAEGYCSNSDLSSGNLRYCILNEPGEKWKLMHYDLDATFSAPDFIFLNVIGQERSGQQVTMLARSLLKNDEFRDRFLTRAGEAMRTVFTNEHVIELIDSLSAEIEHEMIRDSEKYMRSVDSWHRYIDSFKQDIVTIDWTQQAKNNLIQAFNLTAEEAAHYFG